MKVQEAQNQFEEILHATQVFLDEESLGIYTIKELREDYVNCIERVLEDKKKFKAFIEYIEMTPTDFFLMAIMATGCEAKTFTKKMSKELRQTLKEGLIR
jgi:hypothetical protein